MDKIQNDLSQVIMLESLTIPEKQNSQAYVVVNKDVTGVISA